MEGRTRGCQSEAGSLRFSFLIPAFLLVNCYIYFNNISTNARQVLFRYTLVLVVQHLAGAYGYNPVLILPLPDLAGNAVLVWYSMLSHILWY